MDGDGKAMLITVLCINLGYDKSFRHLGAMNTEDGIIEIQIRRRMRYATGVLSMLKHNIIWKYKAITIPSKIRRRLIYVPYA